MDKFSINMLDEEIEYFKSIKKILINIAENKYCLIKGNKLECILDSAQECYKIGINKFGNVPMLITEITSIEKVYYFN